jgi:hypothetical protein
MAFFNPKQQDYHTATSIDGKLYILSGQYLSDSFEEVPGKDFFYLDISGPLNTKELSWQDLSSVNTVPPHAAATSVVGGANNNTLFLYGGNNYTEMELVYTFNLQSNSWDIPKISGNNTIRKQGLTGIIGYDVKMYLWSGKAVNGVDANDMLILDTINLSWAKGSSINAPTPRYNYGAVLLPDQGIIYMGKQFYSCNANIVIYFSLTFNKYLTVI